MKQKNIPFFLSFFMLLSCETSQKSNKTEFISENISELQKKLNISNFKPQKVIFKYINFDNSKGLIPGPSDSFLQVELSYDKNKIDSLKNNVQKKEIDLQIMDGNRFLNKWFDSKLKTELENTKDNLKVYEDFLFNTSGQIILLNDKILYNK